MITLPRLAVSFVCAALMVGPDAHAQNKSDPPNFAGSAIPPDLASMLQTLPKWRTSFALSASYGYKDNSLLSSNGEEQSAFARATAELILLRVPQGNFEYTFFAEAEGTHYFSAATVDHDARVWVQTEPGFRISDSLRVGLPLTGYYNDQAFDITDDQGFHFTDPEFKRSIAQLKVQGLMIGPVLRWDFHRSWWMEAQAVGQRKHYRDGRILEKGVWEPIEDGAHDGELGEGALRLMWSPLNRVEVRASAMRRWRNFDRRLQYKSTGREILGSKLKISEQEGELRFDVTLDRAGHWRTSTRANLVHYRDNDSGYFNYREQSIEHEVEWKNDPWFIRLSGHAGRLDFGVQKAEVGIAPPARLNDEFAVNFEIERAVAKRWTIFSRFRWDRTRSNDKYASYSVNEGLLGVRWSWEK